MSEDGMYQVTASETELQRLGEAHFGPTPRGPRPDETSDEYLTRLCASREATTPTSAGCSHRPFTEDRMNAESAARVQESLDRVDESLTRVMNSIHEVMETFDRYVRETTGERMTPRELAHDAASRSGEERTPADDATATPDREPITSEPGGASHTEALRSMDER